MADTTNIAALREELMKAANSILTGRAALNASRACAEAADLLGALAAQEQAEPVAWMHPAMGACFSAAHFAVIKENCKDTTINGFRPLIYADTHPPAAQPVANVPEAECGNTPWDEGPFTLAEPLLVQPVADPNMVQSFRATGLKPAEAVAAAKAVAAQPVAVPEWRPINTAPKDGTPFLCWVFAEQYGETDEGQQYSQDVSQVDFCQWHSFDEAPDGGWFEPMCGQLADRQGVTHWMPLPAAPGAAPTVQPVAAPDVWLVKVRRLVEGFEHVSGLARLWEPDYSTGSERALWARATEACADVAKLLAAAPKGGA